MDAHVACVIRHKAPMVIASVASPKAAVARLREAELVVFSDVASLAHARKAIDAGADGLVLLTAGAGGHTDWLNGLAFAREVLSIFDGPVVLAGGVCDGAALLAAPALDCDFGYMGTPFAATRESLVSDVYRDRLIAASMDEIVLTREFSGLWGNYLRESISAAGYDPDNLDAVDPATATIKFGPSGKGPKRWTQLQSAGHWVSSVRERLDAAGLMDRLEAQYRAAFATLAPPQRVWIN